MNRVKMLINQYHINKWESIMAEKQQYTISPFVLRILDDEGFTADFGGA